MLTIGLDTHLKTSTLCILDDHGRQINTRTIRGHWSKTVDHIRKLGERFRIVFEASCGYGPLHDALAALPHAARVAVAHPGRLRLIFRSKRKNDRVDAQKLAKLMYLDEVPEAHVPSVDGRAWRELIEFRRRAVDQRTRVKNGLRALLRTHGVEVPGEHRDLWTQAGLAWLKSITLPTSIATLRRDMLLDDLDHAQAVVAKVTRELDAIAAKHAGVALLRTIPGVGPRTAEAVVAYVDDPKRFARICQVGAYFGLVPSQDASAGVNRLGHITKQGPATARKLLVEAAWQVIRRDTGMRAYFDRITAGKPERRKIALIASAHKLVRCMLSMLRTGVVWRAGLAEELGESSDQAMTGEHADKDTSSTAKGSHRDACDPTDPPVAEHDEGIFHVTLDGGDESSSSMATIEPPEGPGRGGDDELWGFVSATTGERGASSAGGLAPEAPGRGGDEHRHSGSDKEVGKGRGKRRVGSDRIASVLSRDEDSLKDSLNSSIKRGRKGSQKGTGKACDDKARRASDDDGDHRAASCA